MNEIEKLIPKDFFQEILNLSDNWENKEFSSQTTLKIQECILSNLKWLLKQNSRNLIQQFFLHKYPDEYESLYKKFLIFLNKILLDIIINLQPDLQVPYEKLKNLFDIIIEFCQEPIYYYNVKLQFLKSESETYKKILIHSFWFYERPHRNKDSSFGFIFKEFRFYNENGQIKFDSRGSHSFKPKNADCLVIIKFIENDLDFIKHNNIYLSILPIDNLVIKNKKRNAFFKEENNFIIDKLKVDWDKISSNSMEFIKTLINSLQLIKDSYFEFYYNVNMSIANLIEKLNENNISVDKLLNKSRILKINQFHDEYFNFELKDINIFIGKNNAGKTFALDRIHLNQEKYQFNSESIDNFQINSNFIPSFRYLSDSTGTYNNLVAMIKMLLISIFFLQNQKYLLYNLKYNNSRLIEDFPNFNFDIEEIKNMKIWNIPFFPEILEFFSTELDDLEYTDKLTNEDKTFISKSFPLLALYKQVYDNWKKAIDDFFPDIEILDPQRIGKGASFKVKLKDKYLEMDEEIENWKELGSGIQELLSIVFYIEYIKISPLFDLSVFIDLLETNNLSYALSHSILKNISLKLIFIDEPEVSLHSGLLKEFNNYLFNISDEIQIFIGTHSSSFLNIDNYYKEIGKRIQIYLMKKDKEKGFWQKKIQKQEIIEIYDELFNYTPLQTSLFFLKNQYSDFLDPSFKPQQIKMIQQLIKDRFQDKRNLDGLLKLGTIDEEINDRLLQNTYFLSFHPELVDPQDNNYEIQSLEKIILFQINKLTDSSRIKLKEIETKLIKENKYTEKELGKKISFRRFLYLWRDCWDFSYFKDFVLNYNEDQALNKCEYIINKLNEININEIIPFKTLIIFPENSIPYKALDTLLNFARQKKVVLIGGLEHKKLKEVLAECQKLEDKYKNFYKSKVDYKNLNHKKLSNDDFFINQAIVINADKYFSFQIKNVPYYNKTTKSIEGIQSIFKPTFRKFKTILGNIAVFVCKDFLVNYSIIDKWMEINDINIIAIPSFSELVNPFRYKLGEIVIKPKNRKKIFIFTNIAEYGGSGAYNFSERRRYEPFEYKIFDEFEEGYKILNLK